MNKNQEFCACKLLKFGEGLLLGKGVQVFRKEEKNIVKTLCEFRIEKLTKIPFIPLVGGSGNLERFPQQKLFRLKLN